MNITFTLLFYERDRLNFGTGDIFYATHTDSIGLNGEALAVDELPDSISFMDTYAGRITARKGQIGVVNERKTDMIRLLLLIMDKG